MPKADNVAKNLSLDKRVVSRAEAFMDQRPGTLSDLVNCLLELHLDGNEGNKPRVSEPFGVMPVYPPRASRRG